MVDAITNNKLQKVIKEIEKETCRYVCPLRVLK